MKSRIRIESTGTIWGNGATKVFLDGVDITTSVSAVTWQINAYGGGLATANLTFDNAEISAEADLAEPGTDSGDDDPDAADD